MNIPNNPRKKVPCLIAKAKKDDEIIFTRNGFNMVGRVTIVNENSVIVELSSLAAEKLDYSTNLTVVNHKKYQII